MIPEFLALGATFLAAASDDDGPSVPRHPIPPPKDDVLQRWNRFRVFRTPQVQRLLGQPDRTFVMAMGSDPPVGTGDPWVDVRTQQYVTKSEDNEGYVDLAWFPGTTDGVDYMFDDDVERLARIMGIVPVTEHGLPLFEDYNVEMEGAWKYEGDLLTPTGRLSGDAVLKAMDTTASLEMLKWGYNLVALPDTLADDIVTSVHHNPYNRANNYRWYIAHPIPKHLATSWLDNVERKNAAALRGLAKGRLIER
jgi:hypothetical protein